jgi:hypothetical protein
MLPERVLLDHGFFKQLSIDNVRGSYHFDVGW